MDESGNFPIQAYTTTAPVREASQAFAYYSMVPTTYGSGLDVPGRNEFGAVLMRMVADTKSVMGCGSRV